MVVVPRLNEAFPSSILVLPLVMVEDPRDVVLWPRVMEEFPMQILVLSLLMMEFPSDRAVLPSVMLVLPIGEEMAVAQVKVVVAVVLVVVAWRRRQSLGLTRRGASDTHAALARGSAFSPPTSSPGMASGGLARQRAQNAYGSARRSQPPCRIMPSLSGETWAGEGHIPPMCAREWTEGPT